MLLLAVEWEIRLDAHRGLDVAAMELVQVQVMAHVQVKVLVRLVMVVVVGRLYVVERIQLVWKVMDCIGLYLNSVHQQLQHQLLKIRI